MRNSLFYGTSKICFPRKLKRDRYGRIVFDSSVSGLAPGIIKQLERKYAPSDESGRSILEIMAVIALITLISVGTIKGYDVAQQKAKARNESTMIATLVKERQIRALSAAGDKAAIQKVKIGDKEITIENGTTGKKKPFFWIDIPVKDKVECEHLVYSDLLEPTLVTVGGKVNGDCPATVRMYFPKDPEDKTSIIETYVNPQDGQIYPCPEDAICTNGGSGSGSGTGPSQGFTCREGYTPNATKTGCVKVVCPSQTATSYAGGPAGYANDGTTMCYCPSGMIWEGGVCVEGEPQECSGHGSLCGSECRCNGGWTGATCNSRITCENGDWSEDGCECYEGYDGTNCETYHDCSSHGTWQNGSCSCLGGFTGSSCESQRVCLNEGTWTEDGCICTGNWMAPDCSSCETGYFGTCGGTCVSCSSSDPAETGFAECSKCDETEFRRYISGSSCYLTPDCGEHGTWCGSGCVCDDGYYGTSCEYEGNDLCSGHGTLCGGYCSCDDGYYGTSCENLRECSGHGTLDWPGANHWSAYPNSCLCDKGYMRDDNASQCHIYDGSGSHRRTFGAMDYGYICDAGYYGAYCDESGTACNDNGQYIAIKGMGIGCLCNDGTIQDGDPINGNLCAAGEYDVCNGHGTLDWPGANHWPQNPNLCLCDKGYSYDLYASGPNLCSQKIERCNSHGQWMGCGCVCDIGYYGAYCENITSSACNGQGRVGALLDGQSFCLCNDNTIQTGDSACASSTECSGHGTLDWPGANHWSASPNACLCEKTFWTFYNAASQCTEVQTGSGDMHRRAFNANEGYVCDAGYYGSFCENQGDSVCNGKGQYIVMRGTGVGCLCDDGTIQDGNPITDNLCAATGEYDVCNGHGTLDWPGRNYFSGYSDLCLCDKGYYGSITTGGYCNSVCNGVCCSGHGQQIGCGCLCASGYCGSMCEYTNSSACNGKGRAGSFWGGRPNDLKFCLCDNGTIQTGENACASTSTECSGNGAMTNGSCVCNTGYSGTNCETECSGNGTIVNGLCVCNSGWYGAQCDSDCNGWKDKQGRCYNCDSYAASEATLLECNRCSNREMYTDYAGRKNCALTSDACHILYPEGGHRGTSGFCISCSYYTYTSASQSECNQCQNTNYPRFWNAGADSYCYPCSYEWDSFTAHGHHATKDECDKCGNLRYYDGTDCYLKK